MRIDRDSFCIGIGAGVLICALAVFFSFMVDKTVEAVPEVIVPVQETDTQEEPVQETTKTDVFVEGIDDDERELIERVVSAEARGESYIGIIAVCQCIKDRGDSWNMTYTEVVLQEGQFADPYEGTVPDLVKLAVHECFDLGYRASESPIYHFYAHEKCTPYWASEKVLVMVEGGHTFMY